MELEDSCSCVPWVLCSMDSIFPLLMKNGVSDALFHTSYQHGVNTNGASRVCESGHHLLFKANKWMHGV